MSTFDNKSINYFIEHGLDKNINKNANITLIITNNRNKTKLESYDFSYKDENKKICIDIPYYHKDVPDGFSVFCTDEEFQLVINHVNRWESKIKIKRKEKKKEENIISEPEPSKKILFVSYVEVESTIIESILFLILMLKILRNIKILLINCH